MRKEMYVTAVCMNTEYAKTESNKFVNNFVHFSQFTLEGKWYREASTFCPFAVDTIIAKCLGKPFEVWDSLKKDTRDNDQVLLSLC